MFEYPKNTTKDLQTKLNDFLKSGNQVEKIPNFGIKRSLATNHETGQIMYTLEFTLAGLPPMTNGNGRQHWTVQYKSAKKWKKLVLDRVIDHLPLKPILRARVTITRHSGMCPDFDGLASGGKRLLDGLVEAGVLQNDKMENIGQPTYLWAKSSPRKGFVTVKVEEI